MNTFNTRVPANRILRAGLAAFVLAALLAPMGGCKKKPATGSAGEAASAGSASTSGASAEGTIAGNGAEGTTGGTSAPSAATSDAATQAFRTALGPESGEGGATDGAAPAAPSAPAAPKDTCFTEVFRHKSLGNAKNLEAFSQRRNLIKIARADVAASSVCIRVNGTPVPFAPLKGKKDSFVLGPIAGPKAIITARYCLEGFSCAEGCKIPRDEFMDAIGGGNDASGKAQAVQWDGGAPGTNPLAEIDPSLRKELADTSDLPLAEDWEQQEQLPICKMPADLIKRAKAELESARRQAKAKE